MPTYDYECKDCGYTFEKFQSMSDDTLTTCPQCKKNELRRLIGGGMGIIFKGSGFYVNDNKAKSPTSGPVKKSEGSSTGAGSSQSESSSKGAGSSKIDSSSGSAGSSAATGS